MAHRAAAALAERLLIAKLAGAKVEGGGYLFRSNESSGGGGHRGRSRVACG
jgi:hypothetical protein